MGAIHLDFYDQNSRRAYPVADGTTRVSDEGDPLPDGVLVDADIRFPADLGDYLILAAAVVNPRLVSLVFSAAPGPAVPPNLGGASAAPAAAVAAVSIPQPIEAGRSYPVDALIPGVGGWVVLGPDAASGAAYRGMFSAAAQSQLLPGCASPYATPPVSSIALPFGPKLVGDVSLAGDGDLSVGTAQVVIDGNEVTAVTFGLVDRGGVSTLGGIQAAYAGPCGSRPESGTCEPPGISQFGPAVPDCLGNINVVVKNASVIATVDLTGFAFASPYTLDGLCPPPKVPDLDGYLLHETPATPTVMLAAAPPSLLSSIESPILETVEELEPVALPYEIAFNDFPHFEDGDPNWHSPSPWGRWGGVAAFSHWSTIGLLGLRCTVTLHATESDAGGVVFDYRLDGGVASYYLAAVDIDARAYVLWRVVGDDRRPLLSLPSYDAFAAGVYSIAVSLSPGAHGPIAAIRFDAPGGGGVAVPFTLPPGTGDDGVFGVATMSNGTHLISFHLERADA